jgi:hypothetical protein
VKPIYKAMLGAATLGGILLVLSGVFDHANGFEGTLGNVGWVGFLLCALTLIVLALVALGRSVFRRATTA